MGGLDRQAARHLTCRLEGAYSFLVVVGTYAACCQRFFLQFVLVCFSQLVARRTFLTLSSLLFCLSVHFFAAVLRFAALCSQYLRVVVSHFVVFVPWKRCAGCEGSGIKMAERCCLSG